MRGALTSPSSIQLLFSILAQTSLAIGAYTSFSSGALLKSLPWASVQVAGEHAFAVGGQVQGHATVLVLARRSR